MYKNCFVIALAALTLSACEGYNNTKPSSHTRQTVDPSNSINTQNQAIIRNVGDRTGAVNQSGHNLPK